MDEALKTRMGEWFAAHREEMIGDLLALVSIRSVAEDTAGDEQAPFGQGCRQALDAWLALANRLGFATRKVENRLGVAWLEPKEMNIALWTHLDVVPEGDGWDFSPFAPVCRDGVLIGRGADDNKGPAVGMLYVLRCLKELNVPLRCGVRVVAGTDEERGMRDVPFYAERFPPAALNLVPDCAFPVCHGEKGILEAEVITRERLSADVRSLRGGAAANSVPDSAEITLRVSEGSPVKPYVLPPDVTLIREAGALRCVAQGKACHAAFPLGGVNAVHTLLKALPGSGLLNARDAALLLFPGSVDEDPYGTALDIRMRDEASGELTCVGTRLSLREGHVVLGLNIRYCVSADSASLLRRMELACSRHGCELVCLRDSAPSLYPADAPVVLALTEVYQACTGRQGAPYVMAGGTYARKLPNAVGFGLGGLPCAEHSFLRAGHGFPHGPDEALDVNAWLEALRIFALGLVEADALVKRA